MQAKFAFPENLYNNYFMWWKVYCWLVIIFTGLGMFIYIWYLPAWTIFDWVSFITGGLTLFVLYSFLHNKKVLPMDTWKIILYINLIIYLGSLILFVNPATHDWLKSSIPYASSMSVNEYLFYALLTIPVLFANYKLGFESSFYNKASKS